MGKRITAYANLFQYKHHNAGFTLIEVLLVVVIIGMLASIIVPRLGGRSREAQITAAGADIAGISIAIEMYEVDNLQWPSSLEALVTETSEKNWHGPYLDEVPIDPWGNPYHYKQEGNGFELRSAGPNETFGDSDDITN
jgi:general secretion pathway protein G